MLYPAFVAAGILLGAAVAMRQRPVPGVPEAARAPLLLGAMLGAVLGAYLLQLPADLLGWTAPPPPGLPRGLAPLGGRTVLGGLIGGWLGVELAKRRLGITVATGDGYALPLAIALCCGRLGCAAAGCCAGRLCGEHWWAWRDLAGSLRYPVQLVEVLFHGAAAVLLVLLGRRGWWPGRRFAAYLAAYALLRFGLEFAREHPVAFGGLTWHQWLCALLFAIAAPTWWRRRPR